MMLLACHDAGASVQHHLVCFGRIQEPDIVPIVKYADTLVVGDADKACIKRIKQLKPEMIILKYNHAIGYHRSYADWGIVQSHEDWFAHDKNTFERMVERRYGWYLMNIKSSSYRQHITDRIARQTSKEYDGIFIDDFWGGYADRLEKEKSMGKAAPDDTLKLHWDSFMTMVLKNVRMKYHGLIYVNGTAEKYIPYVDGCMEEGFVHSSCNPSDFTGNPGNFQRSLLNISRLQQYGKKILLQSGAAGSNEQHTRKLRDYCFASFLLIQDDRTSFDFRPYRGYSTRGLSFDRTGDHDLGMPCGGYYLAEEGPLNENLIPNGSFDEGLTKWSAARGNPGYDGNAGMKGGSAHFRGSAIRKGKLKSQLIPVQENTGYTIALWCKAIGNHPGSFGYMKLGMQGRFFDKDLHPISGAYDMQFNAGSFDWQPHEVTYKSPPGACFFRVTLGFIGDGEGEGWVDNVYFALANKRGRIMRRDYQHGSVLVNFGDSEMLLTTDRNDTLGKKTVRVGPREGLIILNR